MNRHYKIIKRISNQRSNFFHEISLKLKMKINWMATTKGNVVCSNLDNLQ